MSAIRIELVYAAINRSYALMDRKIHDKFHKQHEFKQKTILTDKSLTKEVLNELYDSNKVLLNKGEKRICEHCNQECLATLLKSINSNYANICQERALLFSTL